MFAMGPSLLAGGAPPFSPASLSGNLLWLDASDATTISATTNLVDQWRDKSGNANHASGSGATRFTTNAATQNSKNVMQVASGNIMNLTSVLTPSDYTLISVAKVVGGGGSGQAILASNSSLPPLFGFVSAQLSFDGRVFGANNGSVANIYSGTVTAALAVSLYAGASTTPLASGSGAGANTASFNQIAQYAGIAGFNFAGQIAEQIVYNRVLSAGELGQVFTYLKAKWGTP